MSSKQLNSLDNYEIQNLKSKGLRYLIMKLSPTNHLSDLYNLMKKYDIQIKTDSVKDLFYEMKGEIHQEIVHTRGNHVRTDYVHFRFNEISRNAAVEFMFRILNGEITETDRKYIYNTVFYILTHSKVFTNNIRYHLYQMISGKYNRLLTKKQFERINIEIKRYGHLSNEDNIETDSEPEYDSEDEYWYESD